VRPSYLSPELLAAREATLAREGHLPAEKLARKLGDPDGRMGSGVAYVQYYLHDGLLVLSVSRPGGDAKRLEQPGLDEPATFAQWLQARRAAAGKASR
jgi:predicted RecB family endonuclease